MFVNTCSGCVQIPTPMYYWNPYVLQTYAKNSDVSIAEIFQLHSQKINRGLINKTTSNSDTLLNLKSNTSDSSWREKRRHSTDETNPHKDGTTALNFSVKDGRNCTLTSALEPLRALCSAGPRGYKDSSPGTGVYGEPSSGAKTDGPKRLKFGISTILSEEFGKGMQQPSYCSKENLYGYPSLLSFLLQTVVIIPKTIKKKRTNTC